MARRRTYKKKTTKRRTTKPRSRKSSKSRSLMTKKQIATFEFLMGGGKLSDDSEE